MQKAFRSQKYITRMWGYEHDVALVAQALGLNVASHVEFQVEGSGVGGNCSYWCCKS